MECLDCGIKVGPNQLDEYSLCFECRKANWEWIRLEMLDKEGKSLNQAAHQKKWGLRQPRY